MADHIEAAIAQRAVRLMRKIARGVELPTIPRTLLDYHYAIFTFLKFVARYHGSTGHSHDAQLTWDRSNTNGTAGRPCYRCSAFAAMARRCDRAEATMNARIREAQHRQFRRDHEVH